jgi:hypothetical protein
VLLNNHAILWMEGGIAFQRPTAVHPFHCHSTSGISSADEWICPSLCPSPSSSSFS